MWKSSAPPDVLNRQVAEFVEDNERAMMEIG